jgi:hypothetical protein
MSTFNLAPGLWRVAIVETPVRWKWAVGEDPVQACDHALAVARSGGAADQDLLDYQVRECRRPTLQESAGFLELMGRRTGEHDDDA